MNVLALSFIFCGAFYAWGQPDERLREVEINTVKPTQGALGFREVELKVPDIIKARFKGNLNKLKKKNVSQVVVGPRNVLFLIDGHHFSRALLEAGEKMMLVEIKIDYSENSMEEFWRKLAEKRWVHPFEENGKKISYGTLENLELATLKDDPYRSLSWLTRESEGYENIDEPFQEFKWAEFFRSKKILKNLDETSFGWTKALLKAVTLARSEEAKELPGWIGEKD